MEYDIVVVDKTKKEQVYKYLLKIDKEFPVSLSEKIDIKKYTEKIFEHGMVIGARKEDNLVGILTGYINNVIDKEAYISVLEVSEQYRKSGIAKELLKKFEEMAIKQQLNTVKLYTHNENENAKRFYIKNGYKIKNEEKANYDYSIVLEKKIEDTNFNILLTSVGRRGYLVKYFKEVLGHGGKVYVSNSSDISPAFNYADESVVTPLIYDEGYIDFLLEYCKENDIKAIISLFDIDLPVLSKNKQRFNEYGIEVIVSRPEIIEICNDKWKTYQFLRDNGFNTTHTYINLEEAIQDLRNGAIKYPVIIKPRWGMGSISVMEAETEEELIILYKKAINNIKQSYLKYESANNIDEAILIQEKIKGQEHGLDIINDLNGNYQTTIVKEKYAMRAGETDCAKVISNNKLKQLGESIANKLHHIANMDMDVFLVEDKPYILEMNARFGGGYPFSHMSGVNLPKAIISWLRNEQVDEDVLKEKKIEVLFSKDINIIELKKEG